jgi:hypothetical protein
MGLFSKSKGESSKAREAEAEAEAQGEASSHLAPPPAYDSDDARSSVSSEAPEYTRPRFHEQGSATVALPPAFNVYASWRSPTKLWIGSSADEKKYLITQTFGWSTKTPPITFHSGLSADDPPMVQVGPGKWKLSQECTLTVPSRPDRPDPDCNVKAGYRSQSWREWNYTFTMPVQVRGSTPQEHTFQWRTTTGEEVKLLDKGSRWSSGWKLIWTTGPESGEGVGFGGDGREVVAVAARSSKSMRKVIRFNFMGTGLTGTLGGDWELVVAASAVQLWWEEQQAAAVSSTTAAAV